MQHRDLSRCFLYVGNVALQKERLQQAHHIWYNASMGLKRIEARFYAMPSGKEPVREWLISLARKDRLMIGTDIKTVEFGWPVGLPVCRNLGDGLWEVRSSLDKRIARVLFCITDDTMWLLHGFIKKQQKTPPQEITLARKRMKEILNATKTKG